MKYVLVALLVSASSLFAGCARQDSVVLQGLSQAEANRVVVLLAENNITASKTMVKDGTYAIGTNSRDQIAALQLLNTNAEPKEAYTTLGEVFKKDGFISSPLEEHARFVYAMSQDLQKTIGLIDGVLTVRVHVSLPLPSDNLWTSESDKPSASVLIKYKNGYRIDLLSSRIKMLVSKSVPGLTADMVEVLPLQRKAN